MDIPRMTLVPQEFEIELEGITLKVPDMSKPKWHGAYYTGILSVYKAEVSGPAVIPNSITVIAVFNQEDGPEFLIYATYVKSISWENIVQHLQEQVQARYLQVLSEHTPVSVGNSTLH